MPYASVAQTLADVPVAETSTAEERKRRARIAEALLMQGSDISPIQSWTQGAARLAQALTGGYISGQVAREGRAEEARTRELLGALPPGLFGGQPEPQVSPPIASAAPPAPAQPAGVPSAPAGFQGDRSTAYASGLEALKAAMGGQPAMPDRTKVASTDRVIGDDEGVRMGIYDPPRTPGGVPPNQPDATFGQRAALPPPAGAVPVRSVPVSPPAAPAAAPAQAAAQPSIREQQLRALWGYATRLAQNPATRDYGIKLQQNIMQQAQQEEATTFGKIGTDPNTGEDLMGFIQPKRMKVTEFRPGGAASQEARFVVDNNGNRIPIPENANVKEFKKQFYGVQAEAAAGKFTEGQSKDASFARRMEGVDKLLTRLDQEGLDAWQRAAGQLPFDLGKYVQSEGRQQYDTAKELWITAMLRKESGAVINPDEFRRYERAFFPLPGESTEVVQQKRIARAEMTEAMKRAAGPAYQAPTTVPQAAPAAAPSSVVTQPTARPRARNKAGDVVEWDGKNWVPAK